MIGKFEECIDNYFKKELCNNYGKGDNQFFQENDIVWTLHKKLIKEVPLPYKVYNEYPVLPLVPLILSSKKVELIKDNFKDMNFEQYYDEIGDNYILKNWKFDCCKREIFSSVFESLNASKFKNYTNYFEPKYFDLVIAKNHQSERHDLEIYPEIVIECKYEIDEGRKGKDVRLSIDLPKNKISPILNDIKNVWSFCQSHEKKIGYFILIEEVSLKLINHNKIKDLIEMLNVKSEKFHCKDYNAMIIKIMN